jgi:hypothetical protein
MNNLDELIKAAYRTTIDSWIEKHNKSVWIALRLQYPGLSDEEIKKKVKEEQDKRKIIYELEDSLHKEFIKKDNLVGKIAKLHSPDDRRYCKGCDWGGYEGEAPDWPCRTWRLLV